jgi:methionyl-tRNA formyltransferase
MKKPIRFAFFGTSHIATMVLDELEKVALTPSLVITMPPRRSGRGMKETETEVAHWANRRNLHLAHDWSEFEKNPPSGGWDVAIVVDYGKILPTTLLTTPKNGFLNVHPSLLPRFRGASPMRSAILSDERVTGVSIIRMDEEMDHGPILAQKKVIVQNWPLRNSELERILLPLGGALLAQILPEYVAGNIEAVEQNHDVATYCSKFTKEDGLIDFSDDAYKNLLKVRAFEGWPGTYAFFERSGKRIRVGIIDAELVNGKFTPTIVRPAGKSDMPYQHFFRSGVKPL